MTSNARGGKPPKLLPRKSDKPHELPAGWRWLRLGEFTKYGDFTCDPRIEAVKNIGGVPWMMTKECHPVRRRIGNDRMLGIVMRAWRTQYRHGIRDAAQMIGVSSATLSRVENGKPMDLHSFMKLLIWLNGDGAPSFSSTDTERSNG